MSDGKFVSMNEMLSAAKDQMLKGKEPANGGEWALVINFVAHNVACAEKQICKLFKLMYDIPLSEDEINQIVDFQLAQKGKENAGSYLRGQSQPTM